MFTVQDGRLISCENKTIAQIIIPDSVTTIGARAFRNHPCLTDVIFSPAVKTIGDASFEGCIALQGISFTDGLKCLGNSCFRNCSSLRIMQLPDSVASIHPHAFQGCTHLCNVRLSNGLRRNIESQTFADCVSLEIIRIPAGIQQIKSGAFSGCTALKHVFFENADVLIEKGAFHNCPQLDAETSSLIEERTMDESAIDIRSRAAGSGGRLSNYTERHFVFDGIQCGSIEGVLQSFKCPDPKQQAEICALAGGRAKHAGANTNGKRNSCCTGRARHLHGAARSIRTTNAPWTKRLSPIPGGRRFLYSNRCV